MFWHHWCTEALAFTHHGAGHLVLAIVVILVPAQPELAKKFHENRNILNCNKVV